MHVTLKSFFSYTMIFWKRWCVWNINLEIGASIISNGLLVNLIWWKVFKGNNSTSAQMRDSCSMTPKEWAVNALFLALSFHTMLYNDLSIDWRIATNRCHVMVELLWLARYSMLLQACPSSIVWLELVEFMLKINFIEMILAKFPFVIKTRHLQTRFDNTRISNRTLSFKGLSRTASA